MGPETIAADRHEVPGGVREAVQAMARAEAARPANLDLNAPAA